MTRMRGSVATLFQINTVLTGFGRDRKETSQQSFNIRPPLTHICPVFMIILTINKNEKKKYEREGMKERRKGINKKTRKVQK
jgi:hypothetical protein